MFDAELNSVTLETKKEQIPGKKTEYCTRTYDERGWAAHSGTISRQTYKDLSTRTLESKKKLDYCYLSFRTIKNVYVNGVLEL